MKPVPEGIRLKPGMVRHPGRALAEEMEARGILDVDLAAATGIAVGSIRAIIKGVAHFEDEQVDETISHALRLSPGFFLSQQVAWWRQERNKRPLETKNLQQEDADG